MLPWWRTLSSMQQDIKYVCFMHPGIWVGLHFIHFMVKWQNLSVWVFGSIFIQHKYSPAVLCEYQVLPGILLQITISLQQVSWSVNAKQYVYIQCFFFEVTKSNQVAKKVLQTYPKICRTIIHFTLIPSALRVAYSLLIFRISVVICTCHYKLWNICSQ